MPVNEARSSNINNNNNNNNNYNNNTSRFALGNEGVRTASVGGQKCRLRQRTQFGIELSIRPYSVFFFKIQCPSTLCHFKKHSMEYISELVCVCVYQ
jgi:hypothetical protein